MTEHKPARRRSADSLPDSAHEAVLRALSHPARWWVDIDPERLADRQSAAEIAEATGNTALPGRIRQISKQLSKRAVRLSMGERHRLSDGIRAARRVWLHGSFLDAVSACSFLRNPHTLRQSLALAAIREERLWIEFDASHFENGRYDMVGYLVERASEDGRRWTVNAFSSETSGRVSVIPFVTCFSLDPLDPGHIPDTYVPMDMQKRGLPPDAVHAGLGMAFNEEGETRFLVPTGFEDSTVLCESTLLQGAFGTIDAFESHGMSGSHSLPARMLSEAGFLKWVIATLLVARAEGNQILTDADLEADGGTLDGYLARLGVAEPPRGSNPGPGWANVEDPDAAKTPERQAATEADRPVVYRGLPQKGLGASLRRLAYGY